MGIFLNGLFVYFTWGHWFYPVAQNFYLTYIKGISELFGTEPWFVYLLALFATQSILLFALILIPRHYMQLLLLILSQVLFFSLIAHKEYRFIFIILPILLLLITSGLYRFTMRIYDYPKMAALVYVVIVSTIALLGYLSIIPGDLIIYKTRFFYKSPRLEASKQLYQDLNVCGIYDATGYWLYGGGYYYLGKSVPMYDVGYPPKDMRFVNRIISFNYDVNSEYKIQKQIGDLFIYEREGNCQNDPDYTYYRYEKLVEERLEL